MYTQQPITLTPDEAITARSALAIAVAFLSAMPRDLSEEYEPRQMEALLVGRFDGGTYDLMAATTNVGITLEPMDAKRLRKMRARAVSNADEHGL